MAWIEAHQTLNNHPKLKRAARLAGIEQVAMIGYLMRLWWWCLDYAQDGYVTKYSVADIEDAVDWSGTPGKLYGAWIEAGFIQESPIEENVMYVHDWWDYAGRLIDKRKTDAKRKRELRNASAGHPSDGAKTSVGHPSDGAGTQQQQHNPTKPTEHNPTKQQQQHPPAAQDEPAADKNLVVVAMKEIGILEPSHAAILKAWPEITTTDVEAWGVYLDNTRRGRNGNGLTPAFVVNEMKAGRKAPDSCYSALPDPTAYAPFVLE